MLLDVNSIALSGKITPVMAWFAAHYKSASSWCGRYGPRSRNHGCTTSDSTRGTSTPYSGAPQGPAHPTPTPPSS